MSKADLPNSSLIRALKDYLEKGYYPFHMPGHKRRLDDLYLSCLPYALDITELPGMDNLHSAEGIIKEAMERTAALYGSDKCWYLINGSSCGNLAMISASCRFGGEIIAARNCHHSALHAFMLRHLRVHWVLPKWDDSIRVFGSLDPSKIEAMLKTYPKSEAVFITSPNYEGVVSDIEGIAKICHSRGIPLLVDEAHGAHFGLSDKFPPSAIQSGADLVVQSPHKTLASLTQTAWLHWKDNGNGIMSGIMNKPVESCGICTGEGDKFNENIENLHATRAWLHHEQKSDNGTFTVNKNTENKRIRKKNALIDPDRVEEMLAVYESSSPSYPLMLSLDFCTKLIREQGEKLFSEWADRLRRFYEKAKELKHIYVLCPETNNNANTPFSFKTFSCYSKKTEGHTIFQFDYGKIVISFKNISKFENQQSEESNVDFQTFIGAASSVTNRTLMPQGIRSIYDGFYLGNELRKAGFELEMSTPWYCLAMTSPFDSPDSLERLSDVLFEIDKRIGRIDFEKNVNCISHSDECKFYQFNNFLRVNNLFTVIPKSGMPISGALEMRHEIVPLKNAEGRILGEYIECYPPGIPVLVPGEYLDKPWIKGIYTLFSLGCNLSFSGQMGEGKKVSGEELSVRVCID